MLVKYHTVLPPSRVGIGKKADDFPFKITPMTSNVSDDVANGPRHGSCDAGVYALRFPCR